METVTYPNFGEDNSWAGGVGFDFAAEFGHGISQVVAYLGVAGAADFFEQVGLYLHFADSADEGGEQAAFDRREVDFLIADPV